jgi:hypothetical protein
VTFSGSASDTQDGDLSASISWSSSLDGNLGSGASLSLSTLTVGTHTITASVSDSGGLTDQAIISVTITAANTAPTVSITAPSDGASFEAGTPVGFSGSATDTEDGNLSASISWSSSLNGNLGSGASLSLSTLTVGTHTITASVSDSGGVTVIDTVNITITNTDPVVSITAPTHNDTFIVGQSITFDGSASDGPDSDLDLTDSIIWTSNKNGVIGTGGTFSTNVLTVGNHTITATVTDASGATASSDVLIRLRNK